MGSAISVLGWSTDFSLMVPKKFVYAWRDGLSSEFVCRGLPGLKVCLPRRCGVPDDLFGVGFSFVGVWEIGPWLVAASVFSGGGQGFKPEKARLTVCNL